MELLSLSNNLSFGLGPRSCIGRWQGEVYFPCDMPGRPVCGSCTVFNPCAICRGTCLKDEKTCLEAHVVYVAMFRPDIFKIGVAKASRLNDRLREQGADIAAVMDYLPDGERARRKERELQRGYGVKGNVRSSQKQHVDKELDWDAWKALKAKSHASDEIRLRYFDEQPWMRPLQVKDALIGRVFGIKGRLLVLEKDATLYSFDLNNALGAEVFPVNGSKRQISLKSF